jgi:hypothetical protein
MILKYGENPYTFKFSNVRELAENPKGFFMISDWILNALMMVM